MYKWLHAVFVFFFNFTKHNTLQTYPRYRKWKIYFIFDWVFYVFLGEDLN